MVVKTYRLDEVSIAALQEIADKEFNGNRSKALRALILAAKERAELLTNTEKKIDK